MPRAAVTECSRLVTVGYGLPAFAYRTSTFANLNLLETAAKLCKPLAVACILLSKVLDELMMSKDQMAAQLNQQWVLL